MIFGFDTLSLPCQGLTMTSLCCSVHPLFARLFEGKTPPCHYSVDEHEYSMMYYLVDGTYPSWANFVNTISNPVDQKNAYFVQRQEATRNDVERAFGVLQACFAVVRGPTK
jgi:hypothetical protein